jgi:hypothetical protein
VDDATDVLDDLGAAEVGAGLEHHQRDLVDSGAGAVGVDGGDGAGVAGVDRAQEAVGLGPRSSPRMMRSGACAAWPGAGPRRRRGPRPGRRGRRSGRRRWGGSGGLRGCPRSG